MVADATALQEPNTQGGTAENIMLKPQQAVTKDMVAQIARLSTRITSQINTLQEEHRIFKRPFILRGQEYLETIQI